MYTHKRKLIERARHKRNITKTQDSDVVLVKTVTREEQLAKIPIVDLTVDEEESEVGNKTRSVKTKRGKAWPSPTLSRKRKKTRTEPKKPFSAYMLFARETRAEVIEEFPSANFAEVAQILWEWWQECSPAEKSKFQQIHEKDKLRYEQECQMFSLSISPKRKRKKQETILKCLTNGP